MNWRKSACRLTLAKPTQAQDENDRPASPMSERRAPRLIVEFAFLAALSAALTFARLENWQTAGVMALGWILVAIFEWGALRGRSHYGSGSPPRWYTPQVTLPPPRPLEQFSSSAGYPAGEATNDAPTWIASPAMLADWPVSDTEPGSESPLDEQTHVHDGLEAELAIAVTEHSQQAAAEPEAVEEADPEETAEPEPAHAPPPAVEPQPVSAPAPRRPTAARAARHRIDPLAPEAAKGKRFGRRGPENSGDADVRDGPPPGRLLPMQAKDED